MRPFPTDLFQHKNKKMIFMILGFMTVILLMVWARVFYGSMKAYYEGETYLKEKQYIRAITFFDRSIHWYTPFNPFVERSAEQIWFLGNHAEQKGDIKLALIAFRTIRGGFYSAYSVYQPGREWIKKCDIKINQLMELEERKRGTLESSKVGRRYLSERQKDSSPNIFWTIFLEIGFLGWVGSVIGFIMFPLRRTGETKYSTFSSLVWIGLILVFFAFWIIGMMKA